MRGRFLLAAGMAIAGLGLGPAFESAAEPATGFSVRLSARDGTAVIRHGVEDIATSRFTTPPAYRNDGLPTAMICDLAQTVYGFGGIYIFRGPVAFHGCRPRQRIRQAVAQPEDRTLSGASLALVDLGGDILPAGQAADAVVTGSVEKQPYDPQMDHWRVYYAAKGKFETSPAPFISTAALLRSVKAGEARPSAASPVLIRITQMSRADLIAWHQDLLNRLGYEAGTADGVLGPQTRTAIARFEVGQGLYPSGMLNGRVSEMLHRAAGVAEPAGGRIVVTHAGQTLLDEAIGVRPGGEFGTHVLRLDAQVGWQLLTLAGDDADLARRVFGTSAANQEKAALGALARVDLSAEIATRLARIVGPGSILTIGGASPASRRAS